MKTFFFTTLALVILPFFLGSNVFAQTEPSCGNIVTPADFYYEGSEEFSDPISDCSNPFGRTGDLTSIKLNNQPIVSNGTYPIEETGTNKYGVDGETFNKRSGVNYFLHKGSDYIVTNTAFEQPNVEALEAEIVNFFNGNTIQTNYYTEVFRSENKFSYFLVTSSPRVFRLDPVDPSKRVIDVYNNLEQYIQLNAKSDRRYLLPGTYTAVQIDTDEGPNPTFEKSLIQKIFAKLIPTAHAYYYVNTVTFTLTGPAPEPVGASSVLFLPGIQASRLYTKEEGNENRLWEPNINADVVKLALDENGVSVNQIYTRDVIDEIFGVSNVYRTFINQMNDLKNNEKIIKDASIFAYDWRFSVEDVVADGVQYENEIKNLVAEVESLASNSFTDKVTIVAHSNGGLVGKSLISELQRLGKATLIDKLVMVGTPQLGTPKAIGVLLHGLEQQVAGGLVVDDVTAREVIKNMPGAYSLLPSSKYFEKSNGPIVVADNSNSTAGIRTYGPIESASGLKNFLLDTSNTREVSPSRINQPSVLNPVIFAKHEQLQSRLDNWRAPTGVTVYEVVGTGITTIRGIEYRSFPCVAVICAFGFQMKPYPVFSDEGDETVMVLSASGYEGDKVTAKVDLLREGAQFTVRERRHSNLTESPTVQDFIDTVIRFPYINETVVVPPDFVEVSRKYTVIGAHSPVVLSIVDAEGRKVGRVGDVVNEDIPGSQFIELGGSSYILVPADSNYTASIEGTGTGVYSLTIDSLEGDSQTNEFLYIGASTSPTMKATFTASSSGFSTIKTDSNGDGQIDLEQNLNGEIVVPEIVFTYSDLRNAVSNLQIHRIAKQVLLLQVTLAERLGILASKQPRQRPLELKVLKGIEDTLKIMEKKKIVTSVDASRLYVIINYLEQ